MIALHISKLDFKSEIHSRQIKLFHRANLANVSFLSLFLSRLEMPPKKKKLFCELVHCTVIHRKDFGDITCLDKRPKIYIYWFSKKTRHLPFTATSFLAPLTNQTKASSLSPNFFSRIETAAALPFVLVLKGQDSEHLHSILPLLQCRSVLEIRSNSQELTVTKTISILCSPNRTQHQAHYRLTYTCTYFNVNIILMSMHSF